MLTRKIVTYIPKNMSKHITVTSRETHHKGEANASHTKRRRRYKQQQLSFEIIEKKNTNKGKEVPRTRNQQQPTSKTNQTNIQNFINSKKKNLKDKASRNQQQPASKTNQTNNQEL